MQTEEDTRAPRGGNGPAAATVPRTAASQPGPAHRASRLLPRVIRAHATQFNTVQPCLEARLDVVRCSVVLQVQPGVALMHALILTKSVSIHCCAAQVATAVCTGILCPGPGPSHLQADADLAGWLAVGPEENMLRVVDRPPPNWSLSMCSSSAARRRRCLPGLLALDV